MVIVFILVCTLIYIRLFVEPKKPKKSMTPIDKHPERKKKAHIERPQPEPKP